MIPPRNLTSLDAVNVGRILHDLLPGPSDIPPESTSGPDARSEIIDASKEPHVLVIEDDDDFRAIVCLHLQRAGYKVIGVHDAGAAWDVARQSRILAVVTDFRLPGIDGRSLARQLRRVLKGAPILGFTSWPKDDAALTSPFDVVLAKPDVEPLIEHIRRLTKAS